jgi:hypothetical protein
MKKLLFILFLGLVFVGCEKKGCTIPAATNYNPAADKEDGSCEFPELPLITTSNLSDIYNGQAKCGGNITSDGGSAVTQRGVCYSTSPSPTLNDSFTIDGTGTGSFISSLTGLMGGLYYVRAYATNSVGTAYGNELYFESWAPGLFLFEPFNDESQLPVGWTTFQVEGPEVQWETSLGMARISNYTDGVNIPSENWLISPSVDLSSAEAPILNFNNTSAYPGPVLQVFVSNDYDGSSNPNEQGTWTEVSYTSSGGSFVEVNSGIIPLVAFTSLNVAFKYTGSDSDGRSWGVDDIFIANAE